MSSDGAGHLKQFIRLLEAGSIVLIMGFFHVREAQAEDGGYAEPASMGLSVTPSLIVNERFDSNIYQLDTGEVSAWLTEVVPRLEADFNREYFESSLQYEHRHGVYSKDDRDNYADNLLAGLLHWEFNHRNALDLRAAYNKLHEARGSGLTQGDPYGLSKPLTYHQTEASARYQLGSETSTGRLVLNGGALSKEYDQQNVVTEGEDWNQYTAGTEFYWRFGGVTSLKLELLTAELDYPDDPLSVAGVADTKDSRSNSALTGIAWQITGKTRGEVLLGYRERDFRDTDRDDFEGFNWKLDISWEDTRYSEYGLMTARRERETTGEGNFVDEQVAQAVWKAQWSGRIGSRVRLNYNREDYVGSIPARLDEISRAHFDVLYQMRYWLTWSVGLLYEDSESSLRAFSYERNTFTLSMNATF